MNERGSTAHEAERGGEGADALGIEIAAEYADRVTFAMQQTGIPLVDRIAVTNTGETALHDVTVSVSLDNGECEPWTTRIDRIDPDSTYSLSPETLRLSARSLGLRTEAERTAVRVDVGAGAAAQRASFPVDLLPFDHWPGVRVYPELLAAFVTPNHPKVAALLAGARASLGTISGTDALDGYQSGSRLRAAQIAEACFNAVLARGLGYINPPASVEREGQRVRLVDRLCREGFGSCLDLSLLLAGMWEQAGLHPIVLLIEGHAMPAVWTHEAHLPEPAVDEPAQIRNLIELGELVPVESTLVTQPGSTFAGAVEAAKRKLAAPGAVFCAVDIRAARKRRVRPLPLRDGGDGEGDGVDLAMIEPSGVPAAAETTLDRVALAERAERRSPTAHEPEESGADRIKRWQSRLLDLSLLNRLINFRETGRTIGLAVPDISGLENKLAAQDRFSIHARTDGDEVFLRQQLEAGHLYTSEPEGETQKRLLQLFRLRKATIEETGANPLYLALGMLRWFETPGSQTPRRAPLILLPVQLHRHAAAGAGYRYELSLSEEPLRPNVTLLEKLRTEFGIDTAGLDDLPEDEQGLDVPLILRNFRNAIRHAPRWEVEESAFLGLFSFNKFLMWRDLQEHLPRLRENRLVAHLVDRSAGEFDPSPFPLPERLDDEVMPGDLFCTRDADSSQLAAVRAAADGRTFVLEGPPGTGKSQTIANIIADALGRGKRVLFVAEKMAALGVVHSRLEADGLGRFCLELHSAKASKKEVLAQLAEALEAEDGDAPVDWEAVCDGVARSRRDLNAYVRELHEPRPTGESLYQVLGRLAQLGDGPRAAAPGSEIAATTRERLTEWRERVAGLVRRSEPVDPPNEHPLRGIGRADWSFGLVDESRAALHEAAAALDGVASGLDGFLRDVGAAAAPVAVSREAAEALASIAHLMQRCPAPPAALLSGADAPSLVAELRTLVEVGRKRDAARSALLAKYREEFLEIDHLPHIDALGRAAARGGVLGWAQGFLARRRLRPYGKGNLPDVRTLAADLESARACKRDTARLAAAEVARHLGRRWNGGEADWDAITDLLDWCDRFREPLAIVARSIAEGDAAAALVRAASDTTSAERARSASDALAAAWSRWTSAWNAAAALLAIEEEEAVGGAREPGWLDRTREALQRWSGSLHLLNDWCAWRGARDAAVGAGLADLVSKYERGEMARTDLESAFERGFGEAWFNAVADSVGPIRAFNAASHAATIERFRSQDVALIERARSVLAARLGEQTPDAQAPSRGQSELGILKRELQKKRRHLPTRRLVEALPTLLPRLKPCFLMSPLSVAQYLDAKLPPFDLVVFDEASQIPVWDAIGAIARGKEVIVVGDSKQLPPTTFFTTLDGEEDAEPDEALVEDMESILQECNASGIPAMWLRWHYRSRHESLIAFSNHHYYENRLHTFPSPDARSEELGVSFRHVPDGVYDRGGSRTNRTEAMSVVEEVVRRLTGPDDPGSIGIVTFNQAQQSLIEDLLDAERRKRPQIERYFSAEVPEPVFVKNLENVQGDERDTIIFSVGYGPDQTGRVSMNFGPLNADGGERRLNVAVTRARKRLVVFSSLRADQIDLKRTRAVGVRHFKTFLDYADRGPRAIAEATARAGDRASDAGFEQALRKALVDRGWEVDAQVGCAGYRVDLAVRDPARPGRYLLGIECDGAAYYSARTARDRDRLRQSVLTSLGWTLHRVWSIEWRVNPARCIEGIERALADAQRTAAPGPAAADATAEQTPPDAHDAPIRPPAAVETTPDAESAPTTAPQP